MVAKYHRSGEAECRKHFAAHVGDGERIQEQGSFLVNDGIVIHHRMDRRGCAGRV